MTTWSDWISDKLLHALGWTLVHSIWQLLLVAGILWMALKLARKVSPALTYGMGVGALMLSFLATLVTFLYLWTRPEEILILSGDPVNSSPSMDWEGVLAQVIFWTEQNLSLLVNFWFFGAILFLFRLIGQLTEVRNLRKNSQPFENLEIQTLTDRLVDSLGIRRKIEIRTTERAHSPVTFGVLTPVILLPAALVFQLSPAHLEAVIAHELAHVKRNDYLSNLLLSTLEVLFFFHPCYWWMSQTVKELRENAADELALNAGVSSTDLANALAEVLQFASQHPPELSLAAGKKRNPTLLRIKRMLGYPTENYPQTPLISIPMVLTLLLCAGLVASAPQDPTVLEASFDQNRLKMEQASSIQHLFANQDTLPYSLDSAKAIRVQFHSETDFTLTTADGKTYRISGEKLFHGGDTVLLSPKVKAELEELKNIRLEVPMPVLTPMSGSEPFPAMAPMAPMSPLSPGEPLPAMAPMAAMSPMPGFEIPAMSMEGFEVPAFEFKEFPGFPVEFFEAVAYPRDTTKMSKKEKNQWKKSVEQWAENWAKEAEMKAKEAEKKALEWEAKWKENEAIYKEKMAQWEEKFQKEFAPKLNGFESKMKDWEEANEPRMKEFESKIKEWELANKPRMEEFQKRMEVWQKEQQARIQEFQLLLQEELKKGKN
jgi:beta-lactamase regulating signal transducer with metallopeptidase domain